ncbi:hypothetical protein BGZ70_006575 [Mortierella alpina]|uniref:TIL domain-containing protein n=1 Tax=Mortierella alpina TaxID=64518 RepID=A0A9P6J9U8_MORAP|nr:hypothetical protein BGZ70_006575 [Mortierella alpina]
MVSSGRRYTTVLVLAAIIASTGLLALASAQRDCGMNEVYNSCGSACPITCDNINNMPKVCTLNCVSGCFCAPGLLRRKDGQCVLESECKASTPAPASTKVPVPAPTLVPAPTRKVKTCRKNEVYNSCGSACPITCENINNMPRVCTLNCVPGCFCAPGLFRRKDGQCVKEFKCKASTPAPSSTKAPVPAPTLIPAPAKNSKKCQKNEVFRERKTICERSCKDPKSCSKNRKAGCFCKDGHLRTRDGLCVRKQSCKKSNASKPKSKSKASKPKDKTSKPKDKASAPMTKNSKPK